MTAAQPSFTGGVVRRARARALARAYLVVGERDIKSTVRLPRAKLSRAAATASSHAPAGSALWAKLSTE
eukprot:3394667-Prymnesium_polylepis.5